MMLGSLASSVASHRIGKMVGRWGVTEKIIFGLRRLMMFNYCDLDHRGSGRSGTPMTWKTGEIRLGTILAVFVNAAL